MRGHRPLTLIPRRDRIVFLQTRYISFRPDSGSAGLSPVASADMPPCTVVAPDSELGPAGCWVYPGCPGVVVHGGWGGYPTPPTMHHTPCTLGTPSTPPALAPCPVLPRCTAACPRGHRAQSGRLRCRRDASPGLKARGCGTASLELKLKGRSSSSVRPEGPHYAHRT